MCGQGVMPLATAEKPEPDQGGMGDHPPPRPSPTPGNAPASWKTMKGAFPPSSMDTFFIVAADPAMSSLPTRVDPVKAILRT